jgi:hypothetical protein
MATAEPRRFGLGERYQHSSLAPRGTIVVKAAKPWGYDAMFATITPCCHLAARVNAAIWAGTGAPYTCRGCGWKWEVFLAQDGTRLQPGLPRDARHPHIKANQAEWVSRGYGTRPYRR